MALVCSPYSASWANPSWPASELRETTGKATLMVEPVTPRDEVLASFTGTGEAPATTGGMPTSVVPSRAATATAPPINRLVRLHRNCVTMHGSLPDAGPGPLTGVKPY